MELVRFGALPILLGLVGCTHRMSADFSSAEMKRARNEIEPQYGLIRASNGRNADVDDLEVEDVVESDGTAHRLPEPSALRGILASETPAGGRYDLVEDSGAKNIVPVSLMATGGIALAVTGLLVVFDQYVSANTDGDYSVPGFAAPAAIASGGTLVAGGLLFLFRDDVFVVDHGYIGPARFEERLPALD